MEAYVCDQKIDIPDVGDHQAVFDHVLAHLRKQGEAATCYDGEEHRCSYRDDPNGATMACAVGCLIPDHMYSFDMEGLGVGELHALATGQETASGKRALRLLADALFGEGSLPRLGDIELLTDLQLLHDDCLHVDGPEAMEVRAKSLAEDWSLTYTPPPKEAA